MEAELQTYPHLKSANIHVEKMLARPEAERWHVHDYYQCLLIARGSVVHRQGEQVQVLPRGGAFIMPPGCAHSMTDGSPDLEFYSLSFREALFSPAFSGGVAHRFLGLLQTEDTVDARAMARFQM